MQFSFYQLNNSIGTFKCLRSISFNPVHRRPLHFSPLLNSFMTELLFKYKDRLSLIHNKKCKFQNTFKLFTNVKIAIFIDRLKSLPQLLQYHSTKIVQNSTRNCEYVLAHKVRRSHQILCFYSKLWGERTFNLFCKKLYLKLSKHTIVLLSSSLVVAFDWNEERIPDEAMLRYSAEMSLIEFLKDKRKACLKGTTRPRNCCCQVCMETDSDWKSFVEEEDIVVWKREDQKPKGKGLYSYKMYGRYEDVTAYDFLEAQIDLEYRLTWDTHAVNLRLVDSEPSTNSDVIYWETKWPKLFNNRDYVFKRRYRIDKKRNLIYLVNRSTEHPSCPVLSNKQRVREYWSYMIIKPQTTFDEPGIEFSLTYFDNPGTNMPSSLTTWVTLSEMPDYLKKLRMAALGVAERRGDAPSPLASKTNNICYSNGQAGSDQPVSSSSKTLLLESLRATLFLF